MAQGQILVPGTKGAPLDYEVPGANVIVPRAAFASFDGSAAGGTWVPTLEVISDSGHVVGVYAENTAMAAGGSADCSWFPWWRGLGAGVTPKPPNPIGVLFAWYDFADTSTITLDGSGNIQQIADKSGQGHHASQAVAAQRPGMTTLNGNNAGLFNHLTSTYLGTAQFASPVNQPLTIAAVFTQAVAPGPNYWPGCTGHLHTTQGSWMYVSGGNAQPAIQSDGGNIIQVPVVAPFTQHCFVGLYSGATSYFRQDGAPQFGGLSSIPVSNILLGTQQDTPVAPGENDFLDGKIGEVLFYQGQLSASQLTGLEAYLKAKWGTP